MNPCILSENLMAATNPPIHARHTQLTAISFCWMLHNRVISRVSNIESDNSQNVGLESFHILLTLYKDNLRVEGIGKFFQILMLS